MILRLYVFHILKKCDEVYETYIVTGDQAKLVEEKTQGQATSRIWFQQRSGWVAASKLKSVICTDPSQPSASLIKSICYPEMHKFSSDACTYGCKHETEARQEYEYQMQAIHKSFSVTNSGLVLHPMYPFMGVSPDGLVNCSCCSNGLVEIKCPY